MSNKASAPTAWARRLLLAYLAFVVYGSLVPLNFVPLPWDEAVERFLAVPFLDLGIGSRADWVANLLLFVPLVVLAAQSLPTGGPLGRLLLWSLATALAVGIEFVQLYFPARTVSQNDILAESLGAAVGLGAHAVWGRAISNWLERTAQAQTVTSRLQRMLVLYMVLLFGFSVLPLDLTISPVEIYHKWREGRVVLQPFATRGHRASEVAYEWVTDVLVWLPPGALLFMRGVPMRTVVLQTMGMAAGLEVLQLFVWSRTTDVNDVLLAAAGGWCGAAVSRSRLARPGLVLMHGGLGRLELTGMSVAWALVVLAIFWFPFDFQFTRATPARFAEAFGRVPLSTYYYRSEFGATNELLRKILFFMPGGAMLGALQPMGPHANQHAAKRWPVVLLLAMATLVESGQVMLPGKVADLTDLGLEFFGGLLGLWALRWIRAGPTFFPREVTDEDRRASHPAQHRIALPNHARIPVGRALPVPAFVMILTCAATIYLVARLPGLPYNVPKLVPAGMVGLLAAFGLAAALAWVLLLPAMDLFRSSPLALLLHPAGWAVHGLATYVLLRATVPLEMIHKIIGNPVLGWPWLWEDLGRYSALHAALVMQVSGAALAVRVLVGRARVVDGIMWWLAALIASGPLYLVVCAGAGTDNLVELMSDDASYGSASAAAVGLWAFFFAASAVSTMVAGNGKRLRLLLAGLLAAVVSVGLFHLAQETVIVKYGKVFSAAQFLLSSSRDQYASGGALNVRLAAAFGLGLLLVASMQYPVWRRAQPDRLSVVPVP